MGGRFWEGMTAAAEGLGRYHAGKRQYQLEQEERERAAREFDLRQKLLELQAEGDRLRNQLAAGQITAQEYALRRQRIEDELRDQLAAWWGEAGSPAARSPAPEAPAGVPTALGMPRLSLSLTPGSPAGLAPLAGLPQAGGQAQPVLPGVPRGLSLAPPAPQGLSLPGGALPAAAPAPAASAGGTPPAEPWLTGAARMHLRLAALEGRKPESWALAALNVSVPLSPDLQERFGVAAIPAWLFDQPGALAAMARPAPLTKAEQRELTLSQANTLAQAVYGVDDVMRLDTQWALGQLERQYGSIPGGAAAWAQLSADEKLARAEGYANRVRASLLGQNIPVSPAETAALTGARLPETRARTEAVGFNISVEQPGSPAWARQQQAEARQQQLARQRRAALDRTQRARVGSQTARQSGAITLAGLYARENTLADNLRQLQAQRQRLLASPEQQAFMEMQEPGSYRRELADMDAEIAQSRRELEEIRAEIRAKKTGASAAGRQPPAPSGGTRRRHGSWGKDFANLPEPVRDKCKELRARGKTDAEIREYLEQSGIRW